MQLQETASSAKILQFFVTLFLLSCWSNTLRTFRRYNKNKQKKIKILTPYMLKDPNLTTSKTLIFEKFQH